MRQMLSYKWGDILNFILIILGGLLILLSIFNVVKPSNGSDRIGSIYKGSCFTKLDFILFQPLDILMKPILHLFGKLFFNNIGLLLIGIGLVILGIKA